MNPAVGNDPQGQYISVAKKILGASEYGGMKIVRLRILRFDPNEYGFVFGAYNFVGVENLDIVVA